MKGAESKSTIEARTRRLFRRRCARDGRRRGAMGNDSARDGGKQEGGWHRETESEKSRGSSFD